MPVKITFKLEQDPDGYPPIAYESVWAENQGGTQYAIDNIPFFTREATLGDIVEAESDGNEYVYLKTVARSANSLFRVIYYDAVEVAVIRDTLQQLGCSTELDEIHSLISVNIPREVGIEAVQAFLDDGFQANRWDYEEAIIRH